MIPPPDFMFYQPTHPKMRHFRLGSNKGHTAKERERRRKQAKLAKASRKRNRS